MQSGQLGAAVGPAYAAARAGARAGRPWPPQGTTVATDTCCTARVVGWQQEKEG
jgi:hypothetical protein